MRDSNDCFPRHLASAGKVWDAHNGQELFSFKAAEDIGGSVAFSPDGHHLRIVSVFGGQVTIYDATRYRSGLDR